MSNGGTDDMSMTADEEMALQYIRWTEKALEELEGYLADYQSSDVLDQDEGARLVKEIYGLGHNIKGTGSSFNYNLMTEIGNNLCHYIKHFPNADLPEANVLDAHIRSMRVVMQHRITGEAGDKGRMLMDRLKTISSTSLAGEQQVLDSD